MTEPIVGSVMGWMFGLADIPGPCKRLYFQCAAPLSFPGTIKGTWAGGSVVLGATLWVTIAAFRRRKQQERNDQKR